MNGKSIKRRFSYRREAFRRKMSIRRLALGVMVNLLLVILIGSLVLFLFERNYNPKVNTYPDAVWLSVVTVSTVGYGDSYPVTGGGRVTIVLMLVSGAALLSAFISARSTRIERERRKKVSGLEDRIKSRGHYVVCGWNQRAPFVLDKLREELESERTHIVLLAEAEPASYDDEYVFFLKGNPTIERDLLRANIREAKVAILLADESKGGQEGDVDARTVLTALTIRSLCPDIRMTAEVLLPENLHHLELAGVGEILDSNMLSGVLLAQSARHYGLIGFLTDIITSESGPALTRMPVDEAMAAMNDEELKAYLRNEHSVRPLAVRSRGRVDPYREGTGLKQGDDLLVIMDSLPDRPERA